MKNSRKMSEASFVQTQGEPSATERQGKILDRPNSHRQKNIPDNGLNLLFNSDCWAKFLRKDCRELWHAWALTSEEERQLLHEAQCDDDACGQSKIHGQDEKILQFVPPKQLNKTWQRFQRNSKLDDDCSDNEENKGVPNIICPIFPVQPMGITFPKKRKAQAVCRLFQANLWILAFFAQRYRLHSSAMPDLIQEGALAFLSALKDFDSSKGVRLGTFAFHRIHSTMRDFAARRRRWDRELPERTPPNHSSVSDENIFYDVQQNFHQQWRKSLNLESPTRQFWGEQVDKPTDQGDILGAMTDPLEMDPEKILLANEFKEAFWRDFYSAFVGLSRRAQTVLAHRFLQVCPTEQSVIGRALGISEARVSQIQSSSLKKLRQIMMTAQESWEDFDSTVQAEAC